MYRVFILLIFVVSSSLSSCNFKTENKIDVDIRNKIFFNDSLQKIENNIAKLNLYFDRIRKENKDTLWINYYFDKKNHFTLYEHKLDTLTIENISTLNWVKKFSNEDKTAIIRIINLLNKNFISGMLLEKNCNAYFYTYREIDEDRDNIREIYYKTEDVDTIVINNIHGLYDTKGKLRLTGIKKQ